MKLKGCHCCLWCHISQDQLKAKPTPVLLASSNHCTLDTIISDHQAFLASGGDHKKVMEYHNAVYEPFFDVPLHQVIIVMQQRLLH